MDLVPDFLPKELDLMVRKYVFGCTLITYLVVFLLRFGFFDEAEERVSSNSCFLWPDLVKINSHKVENDSFDESYPEPDAVLE
jgi:hypothetical protein